MSALSRMFSPNQILFPEGGGPWKRSGYVRLGGGSCDISAVLSGWVESSGLRSR